MDSESLLGEVAREVRTCEKCDLCKSRKTAVPGEGSGRSGVLLVGEAPGRKEDQSGRPFVGTAGKRLEGMLMQAGLSRDEVFITNIVKCRPPGNRRPRRDEADSCREYLRREIEALNPSLVVLLGVTALKQFFPSSEISTARGVVVESGGRRYLPTYHPASIIYNRALGPVVSGDFREIKKLLGR
jgi:uracil-DNA glycosylase family 4